MKYTTFNIGLNNNPFSYNDVATIVKKGLSHATIKVEAQLREGVYQPNDETIIFEPTAVIRVVHDNEFQDAQWAEGMSDHFCTAFTQECIPYRHIETKDGNLFVTDELVYNRQFNGDKHEFDAAYFIEFADEVN